MARYAGPRCRKCRQLGFSVCGSQRCALERRTTPPGMHPDLRRKTSDFKRHLIEKQKLRLSYWISEKQFRNYVKEAFKKHGISGETLLGLLERRLDNIVYRLGFAPTIPAARQMVNHGHVLVNGRKVNVPSYILRQRDEISLREVSKKMALVEEGLARSQARPALSYLQVDKVNLKGVLTALPKREEIPLQINEGLVIEHYTRYL
jgi:small subunit ribosomal protein S4